MTTTQPKTPQKKPVHTIKCGSIVAAIWQQDGAQGAFLNFTLSRLYKSGNDWRNTASYAGRNAADIGAAAMMAARWIAEKDAAILPPLVSENGDAQQPEVA